MKTYKTMVIGGGTGGLRTAIAASRRGKTVIIDPKVLGGTCLNTGCIPTKAMLHASHLYRSTKEMEQFGIKAKATVNFKKLMDRVNSIVKEGVDHIYRGLDKNDNLEVIEHKARFVDKKIVEADGRKYTADHIIISTGATNFVPPIKGIEDVDYLDNENILSLKKLPKSIIMIGGGYISMEFATFFSDLGCKVTVLERLPTILAMLDDDIRTVVEKAYDERGITILTNTNILEVKQNKKVTVTYNDVRQKDSKKSTLRAEKMLLATGRVPNINELNLEAAGVKADRGVLVDDKLQTSAKGIYAIGDVTGKALFAHAVKRESHILIDNLFEGKKRTMPWDKVPWAVFTSPPVSGIGKSEKELKELKIDYEVRKAPFTRNGRARILEDQDGFIKVLYNKKNNMLLGAFAVGPNADDLIHEYVAVMNSASPKLDVIRDTIHVHPTLSEVNEHV